MDGLEHGSLRIIVGDVGIEECRTVTEGGGELLAGFSLHVYAGDVPSFSDEVGGEGFPHAGLESSLVVLNNIKG